MKTTFVWDKESPIIAGLCIGKPMEAGYVYCETYGNRAPILRRLWKRDMCTVDVWEPGANTAKLMEAGYVYCEEYESRRKGCWVVGGLIREKRRSGP